MWASGGLSRQGRAAKSQGQGLDRARAVQPVVRPAGGRAGGSRHPCSVPAVQHDHSAKERVTIRTLQLNRTSPIDVVAILRLVNQASSLVEGVRHGTASALGSGASATTCSRCQAGESHRRPVGLCFAVLCCALLCSVLLMSNKKLRTRFFAYQREHLPKLKRNVAMGLMTWDK